MAGGSWKWKLEVGSDREKRISRREEGSSSSRKFDVTHIYVIGS